MTTNARCRCSPKNWSRSCAKTSPRPDSTSPTDRGVTMQFGVFTIGDLTRDPATGLVMIESERIKSMVRVARKAEEVGLDVFATGEHHNPPFVPSSPTTLLGYVAAQTSRIILSRRGGGGGKRGERG